MKKIRLLRDVEDAVNNKQYRNGDVIDLGEERNESAVNRGLAVYVEEKEKEEGEVKKALPKGKGKNVEVK
ncbi:hypothetical protein CMU30_13855 [Elizabethkingia anophelis]|nr:hypothetical protein [Elizabethkingia anophelis]MDV3684363.1 hypothetical protein [Elizabethkingia anophelis]MDV3699705.1 hypothetical protein [Elizabethkingia anophelis]MDV3763642.1 hypothetical protein [Elizabethkingia anophelis]MDV3802624.1 hypothetical protein [Elizabethkingia anophelis]